MSAISVLIPCYNENLYIVAAVESVVRQTFKDWELIIVDDGSDDGTHAVLDSILQAHPDLPIWVIETAHKGCAHATHTAVKYATSPLCTILDGDDKLDVNSLQVIVSFFERYSKVGYAWSRYVARSEGGTKWKEGRSKPLPKGKNLKTALISGWWGALAQRSFRKSAYEQTPGLDPSLPFAVDQQLAMLFANAGVLAKHIPVVTYMHLQHKHQMSAVHRKEQQRCRGEVLRRLGGQYVKEK